MSPKVRPNGNVLISGVSIAGLTRHGGDHDAAFAAYQAMMKPPVDERQRDAALFARYFIPNPRSQPWLRRLVIALMFSSLLLPLVFRWFGAKSVLKDYA